MRLFVAIIIDPAVSRELDSIKDKLEIPSLKTTPDYHITLCFLGDVTDAARVKEALRSIVFSSFSLTLGLLKVHPSLKSPEHIEVTLKQDAGHAALIQLHRMVAQALQAAVGHTETHSFKPHITLARVKFIDDDEQLQAILNDLKVPQLRFKVTKFYLFKSDLTEKGSIYTLLETYAVKS